MFLVFYPISCYEEHEQVINHPTDAFSSIDTNLADGAKDVMRILISQFGYDNIRVYKTTDNNHKGGFMSIGDLVNDMNGEHLDLDGLWAIDLNLTEEEMREVAQNYTADFVILEEGKKPTCFSDGEMVAYGDYEEMKEDLFPEDKALALITNYDKDGKNGIVHVFKLNFDWYEKVGEFPIDTEFRADAEDWKAEVYPKLCELLKV